MDRIFQLFDLLIGKEVGFGNVFMIFAYSLPFITALTVPMGVLVATIATYGRMSGDSEILSIRALGINPVKLISPFFLLALFITIGMSLFNMYILPDANYNLKSKLVEVSRTRPSLKLYEGRFNEISNGYTLWADSIDHGKSKLKDLIIYEEPQGEIPRVINAEQGNMAVRNDSLVLILRNGDFHRLDPSNPEKYRVMKFKEQVISIPLGGRRGGRITRSSREMSIPQLIEHAERSKSKRRKWRYILEVHKKFSIPVASIVFVLLGAPLGIWVRRGGLGNGITLSFLMFMIYYIMLVGGEELCERGILYPSIAMWTPDILIGLSGIFLFYWIVNGK